MSADVEFPPEQQQALRQARRLEWITPLSPVPPDGASWSHPSSGVWRIVSLTSLWLPILLSAVAVFIVSAIIHMVLRYHNSDFSKLPGEDAIMNAMHPHNIPPGDYMFPHGGSMAAMKDPAFIERWKRGPVGILTILPNQQMGMGKNLTLWFIYSLVVSLFAAYLSSRALAPGAPAAQIFRFVGTPGCLGYGMALIPDSV